MSRGFRRVVIVVGFCAAFARGVAAQSAVPRILVIPFENPKREPSIVWLGEASAVMLADDLNALGAPAITREERREAFERLQVPLTAVLTDATVIRIGQLVGASEVVMGSLQLEGTAVVVHAKGIALDTGRISRDIVERGDVSQLFATFDRVAHRIASSGQAGAIVESQQVPLAAFESYIKGLLAEMPSTAIAYLKNALMTMPTYDRARLAMWDVYAEEGEHTQALAAVSAVTSQSPWARRAKFLAGLSYLNLKKNDEAFVAFRALAEAQPSAAVLNDMAVAQLRRGANPQGGPATYFFNRAAELDSNDPDYFFNLGYAYWQARDTQATIYWLREAVRRNAADGEAHFVLGTALASSGGTFEASREKELARRLSSTYEQWERRPSSDPVPRGLERVKSGIELPHAQQIDSALAKGGQRDQQELARFYLDRGRRLFEQENDRGAIAELNRALYLSPYEAQAHLLVGRIHLRNNRTREAIDAFKISLWSSESVSAHLALADAYLQVKDLESAKAEAARAQVLDPASSDARQLLERINER